MKYVPILISTADDKDRSLATRLCFAIRVLFMIIAAVLLFGESAAVEPMLARDAQRMPDRTKAEAPQRNMNAGPDTTVTTPQAAPVEASPAGLLNTETGRKPGWWKKKSGNRKPGHLRSA